MNCFEASIFTPATKGVTSHRPNKNGTISINYRFKHMLKFDISNWDKNNGKLEGEHSGECKTSAANTAGSLK